MSQTVPAHPAATTVSEPIDHRSKLYSLGAAAAGVTMLALAQPAEGTVVITNKTIAIPACAGDTCPVLISLNNNGIADFKFYLSTRNGGHDFSANLGISPLGGAAVIGKPGGFYGYVSALLRGARIGPSDHFIHSATSGGRVEEAIERSLNSSYSIPYKRLLEGKWGGNHPNRFLGVKFLIKGATHYGWIRLTVVTTTEFKMSATITEYGYETIANKSLGAGLAGATSADDQAQETGERPGHPSLGMLALGADGLALWRREEALDH
jgi:hypothetical protein